MPKINAASIEEHVSRQKELLLDEASKLFRRKGFRATDMADIANAMGLARNSLYRYYPNKDHILVACVQRDMLPVLRDFEALEQKFPDPLHRILAWLDLSIDFATAPSHASMQLITEVQESAPELKDEIARLHLAPNRVLERALQQCIGRLRRDVNLTTAMISGMAQSAASVAIRRGANPAIRRELKAAVSRLLQP
jgi:AcrR family transcriptional regulator